MKNVACSGENFTIRIVTVDEIWNKNVIKTCMKLIDGPAKGPCSPKIGQKVLFLEREKGFFKNPFSKGISN